MILIGLEKLEKQLQKKQVWQLDDLMALLSKPNNYIVDAVEVVHGEWLTDRFGLERSICSVCDACYEGDGGNYCRRCGAKMDGGSNNE